MRSILLWLCIAAPAAFIVANWFRLMRKSAPTTTMMITAVIMIFLNMVIEYNSLQLLMLDF